MVWLCMCSGSVILLPCFYNFLSSSQPMPTPYLLSVPSREGSFFRFVRAILSSLVMLGFGFCIILMAALTLTLNSSALPSSNFVHACSIAATYCTIGGFLGTMAKFGPWANSFSSSLESALSEMFITHFSVSLLCVLFILFWVPLWMLLLLFSCEWSPLSLCMMYEQPPLLEILLWHNASSLLFCLTMVLKCLASLLSFMKLSHSFIRSSPIFCFRLLIHVTFCMFIMLMVLSIILTLSFSKDLSALLMI